MSWLLAVIGGPSWSAVSLLNQPTNTMNQQSYNPQEIKEEVNKAAKGRVENKIYPCIQKEDGKVIANPEYWLPKIAPHGNTQLTEEKISKDYPWVTVREVQIFHDKTLGLNDCSRWNGLRVLEKNAWTKYYLENKDRDGIDIEPILTEPSNGMMLPQLTEYNDMNNYKPCPSCGDPVNQDDQDNQAHPYCSANCWYNEDGPITQGKELDSSPRQLFLADLDEVTQQIFDLLSEKNLKYGDSALNPSGIFARGLSAIDLINARMDDKLARLKNGAGQDDEDPEWDLIGYLVLKRIAVKRLSEKMCLVNAKDPDGKLYYQDPNEVMNNIQLTE